MKITKRLVLPLALLFMLACARGQDIHYNYDRGANFAVLRNLPMGRPAERSTQSRHPQWSARGQPPGWCATDRHCRAACPYGRYQSGAQEDQLTRSKTIKRASRRTTRAKRAH